MSEVREKNGQMRIEVIPGGAHPRPAKNRSRLPKGPIRRRRAAVARRMSEKVPSFVLFCVLGAFVVEDVEKAATDYRNHCYQPTAHFRIMIFSLSRRLEALIYTENPGRIW